MFMVAVVFVFVVVVVVVAVPAVEEATSQKPKNVFPFFPTRSNLLDRVNESGYSKKGKKPNSEKEPSEAKRKKYFKYNQ